MRMLDLKSAARASRKRTIFGTVALAFLAFFLAIPVANAAEVMRVTFVRHGETTANVEHILDTAPPGALLTENGQQQAQDLVDTLGDNNYDAIYASTLLRTQQTAVPMSQYLGLPIQVIDGIAEIPAGDLEDLPQADYGNAYSLAPLQWIGLVPSSGDPLAATQPGTDFDGHAFDAGVDNALQTMYDNGDRNVIAFSHGGTIMFWTVMNTNNLTLPEKVNLLRNYSLGNTDYVVIEGNPEDGWTLVNWNGQQISPEPTFEHEVALQVRTLTRQLQQAADSVEAAFATRDLATIATAINRGAAEASFSAIKFGRAVNAEVIKRVSNAVQTETSDLQERVSTGVESLAQNVEAAVESPDQTLSGATESDSDTPATTGVRSKAVDSVGKSGGATDLTDGNKARPGVAKALSRSGEQVREAVEDAREQVSTSVQKIRDAVKKATGQTDKPESGDNTDNAGEKDAA